MLGHTSRYRRAAIEELRAKVNLPSASDVAVPNIRPPFARRKPIFPSPPATGIPRRVEHLTVQVGLASPPWARGEALRSRGRSAP